ncbi:hypothetical protein Gotur_033262 [Gossypium turneri]
MVFFVVVQGVSLLLGMLHLPYFSSLDTFGMVLVTLLRDVSTGIDLDLDAQMKFGAFQKLGDPTIRRQEV